MEVDTVMKSVPVAVAPSAAGPQKKHRNRGKGSEAKKKASQEAYRADKNLQNDKRITDKISERFSKFSMESNIFSKLQANENGFAATRDQAGAVLVATSYLRRIIAEILEKYAACASGRQARDPTYCDQQRAFITVSILQTTMRFYRVFENTVSVLARPRLSEMTSEERSIVSTVSSNLDPIVDFIHGIGAINIDGQTLVPVPWTTNAVSMNFTLSTLKAHVANPSAAEAAALSDSCLHGINIWNPATRQFELFHPQHATITPEDAALHLKFITGIQFAAGYKIEEINYKAEGCASLIPTCDYRPFAQEGHLQSDFWHQATISPVCALKGSIFGYGMLPSLKRPSARLKSGSKRGASHLDEGPMPYEEQDQQFIYPWRLSTNDNVRYHHKTFYRQALDRYLHYRKTGLP